MDAWRQFALLDRRSVRDEFDQLRPDTAVISNSSALGGGSISHDALLLLAEVLEGPFQMIAGCFTIGLESQICSQGIELLYALHSNQLRNVGGHRIAALRRQHVAHRPAVSNLPHHIDYFEAMGLKCPAN